MLQNAVGWMTTVATSGCPAIRIEADIRRYQLCQPLPQGPNKGASRPLPQTPLPQPPLCQPLPQPPLCQPLPQPLRQPPLRQPPLPHQASCGSRSAVGSSGSFSTWSRTSEAEVRIDWRRSATDAGAARSTPSDALALASALARLIDRPSAP